MTCTDIKIVTHTGTLDQAAQYSTRLNGNMHGDSHFITSTYSELFPPRFLVDRAFHIPRLAENNILNAFDSEQKNFSQYIVRPSEYLISG